jgi:hypothetical protein
MSVHPAMKRAAPVELITMGVVFVVLGPVNLRYYDRVWGPMLRLLAAFRLRRREDHRLTDLISRRIVPGVFVVAGAAMTIIGIVRSV